MATLRKTAREILNATLRKYGFQLLRLGENVYILSFLPFKRTLKEARKAGLTVGNYIDGKFQVPGATQSTIDQLAKLGVFDGEVQRVCEVGPGSGRYLEQVQRLCAPRSYEIYETSREWSDWLVRSYYVTAHDADGTTLRDTATGSVDLVHAHKVYVYLPFVVTCRYFDEMIRIARPGGEIVFDIVSENCMADPTLEKWVASGIYYPCIMPREFVIQRFARRNCSLRASFLAPLMPGQSEYLVFEKQTS
jgi:Methyltransferase domain